MRSVTRRSFLAGFSLLALLAGSPDLSAGIFPRGTFYSAPTGAFRGNPLVSVSSIDTSGGLTVSKALSPSTAGKVPCHVMVSCDKIAATATAQMNGTPFDPFQDLEYTVNFGDASGTEIFTDPRTGLPVNANIQVGAVAAYCYRTAGSYTITVSIRGANGSGGYVTASVTALIVVGVDNNTQVYADSSANAGTADGTSSHPWVTQAQVQAAIGANITLNVAANSSWSGAGPISGYIGFIQIPTGSNNFRMRKNGAGANPTFTITGGNGNPAFFMWNNDNSTDTSDICITDIDFIAGTGPSATGSTITAQTFSMTGTITDDVFNVTIVGSGTVVAGATITGTSVAANTKIVSQLTGTTGGIGTYQVSIGSQTVASTTISGTYGRLTIGTLTSVPLFPVGRKLLPTGSVVSGTTITQSLTGTGGSGSTFVVDNNTAVSSQTISAFGSTGAVINVTSGVSTSPAKLKQIVFDRCNLSVLPDSSTIIAPATTDEGLLFWGGSITNPTTNTQNQIGLLCATDKFFGVYGTSFIGAGSSSTFDHHIYPSVRSTSIYKWIPFGNGPGRGFCINGNYDNLTGEIDNTTLSYCESFVVSECFINGTSFGIDLGNNINQPVTTLFKTVVIEANAFTNIASGSAMLFACGLGVTVRDNRVFGMPFDGWYSPATVSGAVLQGRIYRNKISYGSSTAAASYGAIAATNGTVGTKIVNGGGANPAVLYDTNATTFTGVVTGATIVASLSGNSLTVISITNGTMHAGELINWNNTPPGNGSPGVKLVSGPFGSTGTFVVDWQGQNPYNVAQQTMTTHTLFSSSVTGTIVAANNGIGAVFFDINGQLNPQSKIQFGGGNAWAITPAQQITSEAMLQPQFGVPWGIAPVGATVRFYTGTPPSPFALNTDYFIAARPVPGCTYTLSATKGGSAIATSGSGSGLTMATQWSVGQVIYANQIQDERTAARMMYLGFRQFKPSAAGGNNSLINNNQYYAPNISGWPTTAGLFFDFDAGTAATFATWKGSPTLFDLAGSQTAGFGWNTHGGTGAASWSDMN